MNLRHGYSLFLLSLFLLSSHLYPTETVSREQVTYLLRTQEIENSLRLYWNRHKHQGEHDFELLEQMALMMLEEGGRSRDPEKLLSSLLALKLAGVTHSVDILNLLENGIKSPHPQTQLFAVQFLGALQDDQSDSLLTKAMHSDFLQIRMEAAYVLAFRKSKRATGQIEALMHKLPPILRSYFPNFFAMMGTKDATKLLKQLLEDQDSSVRVSSILSCAYFNRDDFLPKIRSLASQSHIAEQEAAAAALGELKDSHSLPLLKKLSSHTVPNLRLASLRSLYLLGEKSASQEMIQSAAQGDLFAISLLADILGSESTLIPLLESNNFNVRLNAALSLLHLKNPSCMNVVREILIQDTRDLRFQPHYSLGSSLITWKTVSSIGQEKELFEGAEGLTLAFKEEVLRESLELPQECFIQIAKELFSSKQTKLIPLLIALLENLRTPEAISLLKEMSEKAGAPLVRAYSNLALFRMNENGPYEARLFEWISQNKEIELLNFRPLTPRLHHLKRSQFELTPDESAHLFIESLQTLAESHEEKCIGILIELLKTKNFHNRMIIAGLLLCAIQ